MSSTSPFAPFCTAPVLVLLKSSVTGPVGAAGGAGGTVFTGGRGTTGGGAVGGAGGIRVMGVVGVTGGGGAGGVVVAACSPRMIAKPMPRVIAFCDHVDGSESITS